MGTIIRIIKGFCMGALYGVFVLGILFLLLFVLPVIWFLNRVFEQKPRMQGALRVSFRFWLSLLGLFGLLRDSQPKGKLYGGPCVVVCNHPGLFDVLFLIRDIPNLSVLVKYSLIRKLPLGPILRSSGYVLVPDYESISPLDCAEETINRVETGSRLQLFPEGTRSPAGGLLPFKSGAFKIARLTNVPVQPVLIKNYPPFLPKGGRWYYPPRETSRFQLEFWEAIMPPARGKEKEYTQELEQRYRRALGLVRTESLEGKGVPRGENRG